MRLKHRLLPSFFCVSSFVLLLILSGCAEGVFVSESRLPKGCARVLLEPERQNIIDEAVCKSFEELLSAFLEVAEKHLKENDPYYDPLWNEKGETRLEYYQSLPNR